MLKINASYGLKAGRPNYGSESALCSVELEVSETLSGDELREKIHSAFKIVRAQVSEELGSAKADEQTNDSVGSNAEIKGSEPASNAQLKFLSDIARQADVSLEKLTEKVRNLYQVDSIYALSKKDCSSLITEFKRLSKKAA